MNMKCCALTMLLATILCAGESSEKKALQKELEKLDGSWVPVSYEVDGMKSDEETLKSFGKVVRKNGKYTWSGGGWGTIVIDPTKTPKHINFSVVDGQGLVRTYEGIYEIDGDRFKECHASPGGERPSEFKTSPSSGHGMMVLQREKSEK
jgi:uncharacterized protein (TIGR03067 family)